MSAPTERPQFIGAKSFGKDQWPIHISKAQKDFYNHIVARGFTEEEVRRFKANGNWNGDFHEPVKKVAE